MSEEELNQELSTDELKDVAGGFDAWDGESGFNIAKKKSGFKRNNLADEAKWTNRLTLQEHNR